MEEFDLDISVDHVVPGATSAAFMVTVTLPDGRRIIENVIIESGEDGSSDRSTSRRGTDEHG